ncbi:multidrug effflux MFS transporter [Streptomyces bambusae]|uniref:multidrug effflux MFS transporter n=1 Tax=Streptomyces bambusae TaxID=1550616 RepID=UPI001CFF4529|nr:multidrug effflux MFS transporter [Streptomyces bambusae]MCB5163447.1 multidrug effflux MFS transporter [Streptomyces bambusae]
MTYTAPPSAGDSSDATPGAGGPATAGTATTAQPVSRPVPRPALRLVVVLGALSAFGPLSLDMYLPGLPDLAGDLHVGAADAQLTLTACLLGLAFGQLVGGPMADRWGRRRPLLWGLAGYAVASVLCAFAPNAPALTGLRLLQGLAGGFGIVIARAVVSDLYEGAAAARVFSLLMIVNGAAPILAPLAGGQLLRLTDWRGVFLVLALTGAAILAGAALLLRETLPAEARGGGGPGRIVREFGALLRERRFLGPTLTGAFAFAGLMAYIAGSPFLLQEVHGLSAQQFSLVFGGNSLGLVLAGQIGGRLVRRVPMRRLVGCGVALQVTGAMLLLLSAVADLGLPGVLPALLLIVSSIGLIAPNTSALALEGRPRTAGTASALLGLCSYAMGGLTAPLAGLSGTSSTLPLAVSVATTSALALTAHLTLTRRSG